MALERLKNDSAAAKTSKLTQAQTKVSFFYLNPLLQVKFWAIFEPLSYILFKWLKT